MQRVVWIAILLVGCGMTKDLKDTRALGIPYYKKVEETFFKHANRQGFVMENGSYSLISSDNTLMAHSLPIKKSLFEQDVINGAVIGYSMVIDKTGRSDTDGMYTIKIDDTSDMENVTSASLNGSSGKAGDIAITVTKLEEYNEQNPGGVCQDVLGGGCGAFYINFYWYCVCVHPELIS